MDADFISALYELNKLMPKGGMPVSRQAAQGFQDMTRQEVPTGPEGDQRSELARFNDAYDQPERHSNALLRYGDKVVVPDVGSIGNALMGGLEAGGGAMMGMSPVGGSLGELAGLPKAIGNYLSPAARGLTAEGKTFNRLLDTGKAVEQTRADVARFNPRATDFPSDPYLPAPTKTADKLSRAQQELEGLQSMQQAMPGKNAQRLDEFRSEISQALDGPKALPKPDAATRASPLRDPDFGYQGRYEGAPKSVRNEANPDIMPIEKGGKQASQRYEFDRNMRAADDASKGPQLRSQMAADEHVDKFVGSLAAKNPSELPEAIGFYADTAGIPFDEVVASMARRGYDIQRLATHVYQTRSKGGQFGPLDPAGKRFLDAARATRKTR